MKKISIIASLVAVAASLSSCDDFLNDNRYPLDQQTNNPSYWSNPANVQKQVDNLYTNFIGYATGTSGLFYFQTLNDDQGSGVGGAFTNWAFTSVPASSTVFTAPYEVIRQCNNIIEMVPQGSMTQTQKDKYVGIAKMIRAMKYYQLVRAYGDVPYVTNSDDMEQVYGARTDRDVVMDYVYEDLKAATEGIGSGTKTTYSSDMAYAMMSHICLYEGTYCKYRTQADNYKPADLDRANKYLGYAAAAAKVLIDNPAYQLNESYIANYNSPDLSGNPEMIFYKTYKLSVLTHLLVQYLCQTTPIAGINKDAFDSYLFKDGKPLALTSENKSDAGVLKKGIVAGLGETATIGDIVYIGDLLNVRDKRLSETIDSVVCYTGANDHNMTWARGGAGLMTSSTGYTVRKYDNVTIPLEYRNQSNYTNAPVFWLAVVYLDYAEAKAELGTLTDDDVNKTLNKLYARAELPAQTLASLSNMNDPANNTGVSSLIFEVRRCRRCELIMDNEFRFWDLQRWHLLDRLDTAKNPNIKLGANLGDVAGAPAAAAMSGKYIQATPTVERVFSAREYLYPIPSGQITLNEALTQQPLWK